MQRSEIKELIKSLCCSECRNDFDENSINILNEAEGLIVFELKCSYCKKDFGISFLSYEENKIFDNETFEIIDFPNPITSNEVIEAHRFIKKLDKDWNKYIPDDLKKLK